MILIDKPTHKNKGYAHMVASTLSELHDFAKKIGVKRHQFENKKGKNRPHYDIKGSQIKKALTNGAKQVNPRDIIRFLINNYTKCKSCAIPLSSEIAHQEYTGFCKECVEFDKNFDI